MTFVHLSVFENMWDDKGDMIFVPSIQSFKENYSCLPKPNMSTVEEIQNY